MLFYGEGPFLGSHHKGVSACVDLLLSAQLLNKREDYSGLGFQQNHI